jgi:hypothetical protein
MDPLLSGPISLAEVCNLAWETVISGYVLDDATNRQLATWRLVNDRDVRHALEVLQQLGAVRRSDRESVALSELSLWGLGRRLRWAGRTATYTSSLMVGPDTGSQIRSCGSGRSATRRCVTCSHAFGWGWRSQGTSTPPGSRSSRPTGHSPP